MLSNKPFYVGTEEPIAAVNHHHVMMIDRNLRSLGKVKDNSRLQASLTSLILSGHAYLFQSVCIRLWDSLNVLKSTVDYNVHKRIGVFCLFVLMPCDAKSLFCRKTTKHIPEMTGISMMNELKLEPYLKLT